MVLIGGLPRSGTTLVETVVGSHSRISMPPGDLPFAQQAAKGLSVPQIFKVLTKFRTWEFWQFRDVSSLLELDHGPAFSKLLSLYAEAIGKDIPGAKAPFCEFFLEDYRRWLSGKDLKFIGVIRNPIDVMASIKRSPFHKNWQQSRDLIEVQCGNWVRSATIMLARQHSNPEGFRVQRFEDFIGDPMGSASGLCDFVGVDFEQERMLNRADYPYHDTNTSFQSEFDSREGKTTYIYVPKSRKSTLTAEETDLIGRICGEVARSLNYDDEDLCTRPPARIMSRPKTMTRIRRLPRRIYRRLTA